MCVFDLSSFTSMDETTYATHCPSGESCGSRTSRSRLMSSRVIGCLAVCACGAIDRQRTSTRNKVIRRECIQGGPPRLQGYYHEAVGALYERPARSQTAPTEFGTAISSVA